MPSGTRSSTHGHRQFARVSTTPYTHRLSYMIELHRQRFGEEHNFTDGELKILCDEFYVETDNGEVDVLDPSGDFAHSRDPRNASRGDKGSIKQKAKSVEDLGLLQGIREGPVLRRNTNNNLHWWNISWATMMEGVKQAWTDDAHKEKLTVQLAVRTRITRCTILKTVTPDDAVDFYTRYHNITNRINTGITILEVIESTDVCEEAFRKHKEKHQWTIESVGGTAAHDSLRFNYANGLYKLRWNYFRHYEVDSALLQQTKTALALPGPDGKDHSSDTPSPAREQLSTKLMHHGDFSHPAAERHIPWRTGVYTAWKQLRGGHPHWMADIAMMMTPTPDTERLGKCRLYPDGLGNLATATTYQ